MSSSAWSPERRAAQAAMAREQMKQLNERMRADPAMKARNVATRKLAWDGTARTIQGLVMKETIARHPEMRELATQHFRRIGCDPRVIKKAAASRTGKKRGPYRKRAKAKGADATFVRLLSREAKRAKQLNTSQRPEGA